MRLCQILLVSISVLALFLGIYCLDQTLITKGPSDHYFMEIIQKDCIGHSQHDPESLEKLQWAAQEIRESRDALNKMYGHLLRAAVFGFGTIFILGCAGLGAMRRAQTAYSMVPDLSPNKVG